MALVLCEKCTSSTCNGAHTYAKLEISLGNEEKIVSLICTTLTQSYIRKQRLVVQRPNYIQNWNHHSYKKRWMKNDEYQRVVTLRNIYIKKIIIIHTSILLDLPLHRKIPEDIQCMREEKKNKQEKTCSILCLYNHDYKQSPFCPLEFITIQIKGQSKNKSSIIWIFFLWIPNLMKFDCVICMIWKSVEKVTLPWRRSTPFKISVLSFPLIKHQA